ncbi:hypothetical protein D3C76_843050 [compost metagenome]
MEASKGFAVGMGQSFVIHTKRGKITLPSRDRRPYSLPSSKKPNTNKGIFSAHCINAGSSPSHASPRTESPDTPPEAIPLGRKNKLNPTAMIKEPTIISRVSKICLAGPFMGISPLDFRLRNISAILCCSPLCLLFK